MIQHQSQILTYYRIQSALLGTPYITETTLCMASLDLLLRLTSPSWRDDVALIESRVVLSNKSESSRVLFSSCFVFTLGPLTWGARY